MSKDNMNMSFLVCCANGAGSSLMMKMTLQKVLNRSNIKVSKLHHCALSEGKSVCCQFDVILCAQNFIDMFAEAQKKGSKVIGLKNIMSDKEMEEKMRENGII